MKAQDHSKTHLCTVNSKTDCRYMLREERRLDQTQAKGTGQQSVRSAFLQSTNNKETAVT